MKFLVKVMYVIALCGTACVSLAQQKDTFSIRPCGRWDIIKTRWAFGGTVWDRRLILADLVGNYQEEDLALIQALMCANTSLINGAPAKDIILRSNDEIFESAANRNNFHVVKTFMHYYGSDHINRLMAGKGNIRWQVAWFSEKTKEMQDYLLSWGIDPLAEAKKHTEKKEKEIVKFRDLVSKGL